jgi:hypothetical protein
MLTSRVTSTSLGMHIVDVNDDHVSWCPACIAHRALHPRTVLLTEAEMKQRLEWLAPDTRSLVVASLMRRD